MNSPEGFQLFLDSPKVAHATLNIYRRRFLGPDSLFFKRIQYLNPESSTEFIIFSHDSLDLTRQPDFLADTIEFPPSRRVGEVVTGPPPGLSPVTERPGGVSFLRVRPGRLGGARQVLYLGRGCGRPS